MKLRYLNSLICLCLSSALAVSSAQALDIDKEHSQGLSHYIMALYCQDLGDIEMAIQEYRKALENDAESSLLHLNLAAAFIKNNEIPSAILELKQSADLDPEAVEPHVILALVYTTQNKTDLATQEYALALKNAAKLEPQNIEIYKSLGVLYLQQAKLREAEGIFKIVSGLAPLDEEAHFYLGSIYYDLKDYPAAEKEFKAAIKLKSDYHEALNYLGYFYLEQNRNIDKAGRLIKKALGLDPENGAYLDSLGWYYFKKGDLKEALSQLEKAASFLNDPVIYEHLGDVFIKLGNRQGARLNWEKSLKLDSTQGLVKEKLLQLSQ